MSDILSLLGDLVRSLISFIPRIGICRATHGGIKFVRGWKIKKIEGGLYAFWPLTTEVVVIPVVRQCCNPPAQVLTTKDGKTVVVSPVLVVEITDVVKALGRTWDIDDLLLDIAGLAAVQLVADRTWDELRSGSVAEELAKKSHELLKPYGVKVTMARLTDCAECEVYRVIGNGLEFIPINKPKGEV
jgi:regulator of protease activity HflC (stomatin/prohibitin superfamily)